MLTLSTELTSTLSTREDVKTVYGIDFGTSNMVVVKKDETGTNILPIESNRLVSPSTLFISKDGSEDIGWGAIRRFRKALQEFDSRDIPKEVRFFQGLKLALREEAFIGTVLFPDPRNGVPGIVISPQKLIGKVVKQVFDKLKQPMSDSDYGDLVVGRPVSISEDPEQNELYARRMKESCELAGFKTIHFVYEPVAATMDLVGRENGNVLVFDFGGGTLDVTVSRIDGDDVEILSNGGLPVGGYTINEDISSEIITSHFGFGETYKAGIDRKELRIPYWVFKQLTTFYPIPTSESAKIIGTVRDMLLDDCNNTHLKALQEYYSRGLVYDLFEVIDQAKIELTESSSTRIQFSVGDLIRIDEELTISHFNDIVEPRVAETRILLLNVLKSAGMEPSDIDHVVRVGGSSQIPAFREMLEKLFPGKVQEGSVFTSIASGLIAAHERGHSTSL